MGKAMKMRKNRKITSQLEAGMLKVRDKTGNLGWGFN